MNNKIKKVMTKAVIGIAVKSAKMPNQICPLFFGKPGTKIDLSVRDYEKLEDFMNQKC